MPQVWCMVSSLRQEAWELVHSFKPTSRCMGTGLMECQERSSMSPLMTCHSATARCTSQNMTMSSLVFTAAVIRTCLKDHVDAQDVGDKGGLSNISEG